MNLFPHTPLAVQYKRLIIVTILSNEGVLTFVVIMFTQKYISQLQLMPMIKDKKNLNCLFPGIDFFALVSLFFWRCDLFY